MAETRIVTAAQMRWADEKTMLSGISSHALMDRAGKALSHAILEYMPDYGRIVIVAGGGNNAGDGYAAAHYLRQRRLPVTVVSLVPLGVLSDASKAHAEQARAAGVKIREACLVADGDHCESTNGEHGNLDELNRWLLRAVLVVDAVFGIGLNRPLSSFMVDAIERINRTDRPVLSVDIASGLCADSGVVLGAAVQADCTLPIAASKWGHWLSVGRDYTGTLLAVADIGIADSTIQQSWQHSCVVANNTADDSGDEFCVRSTCLIDDGFLYSAWPARARLSHKGSYGHVCIFGGDIGHAGAPQLAGLGAYAAGAGLVSLICPDDVWPVVAAGSLDLMCMPESCLPESCLSELCGSESSGPELSGRWQHADAIVAGPGWGLKQSKLLKVLLAAKDKPLLMDADALNLIAADRSLQQSLLDRTQCDGVITVMTPHPGEAARLLDCTTDEIQANRKESVLALTTRYACWVVLKGSETLIASPQGDIYLNPFGSAQLAIAGSGDVLAGMIGAQLGRLDDVDVDLAVLIAAAVALHAKAGECRGWYLASELAKQVADLRQAIECDGKLL